MSRKLMNMVTGEVGAILKYEFDNRVVVGVPTGDGNGSCSYHSWDLATTQPYKDSYGIWWCGQEQKMQYKLPEIQVKFLVADGAKMPGYSRDGDVGMDICAYLPDEKVVSFDKDDRGFVVEKTRNGRRISSRNIQIIPTGIKMELPEGYECQVRPRSGLMGKSIWAGFGTVDTPYRGALGVVLANFSQSDYLVLHGERIAQLVFAPVTKVHGIQVDSLSETDRGEKGFGSSGKF